MRRSGATETRSESPLETIHQPTAPCSPPSTPGNSSRPVPNYWRVLAAVGPVFSLTGRPLSGPFVQPKLI